MTGFTGSLDFPTAHPLQPTIGGGAFNYDAFVAKLTADGAALVYATYLGGSSTDQGTGIAVDAAGQAYVTGVTLSLGDFPTAHPLQPTLHGDEDAFVAKLTADGSALVYATYLGGSSGDAGQGIAVDSAGAAYVTGFTVSPDFPTAHPLQPAYRGGEDAFVTKIAAAPVSCLRTGTHRLQGRVRTAEDLSEDPSGLPDVTVMLTGPGGCQDTTTTTATGHYVFRTLGSGTYTVTPTKEGCTFTPPSRTVTLAEADPRANFRGTCAEDEEGERERKERRDRD